MKQGIEKPKEKKITENQSWFLKKNKIDKPLARRTKKQEEPNY